MEDLCDFRACGWKQGKAQGARVLRATKDEKTPVKNIASNPNRAPPKEADGWKEVKKSNTKSNPKSRDSKRDKSKKGRNSPTRSSKDDRNRSGGGAASSPQVSTNTKHSPSQSSRNSDHRKGSGHAPSTQSPSAAPSADDKVEEEISPEEAESYRAAVISAMDEYFDADEIESVTYAVEKDFPESYRPTFVAEAVKHSFTTSDKNREKLADLLFSDDLVDLMTKEVLRKGLQLIVDELGDLTLDHPQAPKKVGVLFARAVNESFYSFKELYGLFDQSIDEGRGFGVCGEALGTALSELVQSSSAEKLNELVTEQKLPHISVKLLPKARTQEKVEEYLKTFNLKDVFPGNVDISTSNNSNNNNSNNSNSNNNNNDDIRTRATSRGEIPVTPERIEMEKKRTLNGLKNDPLAMAVFEAYQKGESAADMKKMIQSHLVDCDNDWYGQFKAAKSVIRGFLEHVFIQTPENGFLKQLDTEVVKKESKAVKTVGTDFLVKFVGSDKSEIADILLEVFVEFSECHPDVASAFYMRHLQCWCAYGFMSTAKLTAFSTTGNRLVHKSTQRIVEILNRKKEAGELGTSPSSYGSTPPQMPAEK